MTNLDIAAPQRQLAQLLARLASSDGSHATAIPALSVMRASSISEPLHAIYEPSLFIIVQGSKTVRLGNESYPYDTSSYLVASVHLPVAGQITEATPQKPYLSAKITFSMDDIIDIIKDSDQAGSGEADSGRGLLVNKTNPALLDAVLRLARLLDSPQDIPFLAPLVIREILYRIMQDGQGELIRQFAMVGSHAQRIARVIRLIQRHYAEPLRIDELARQANMSASTLHSQFKKVTAMSPLQYQKLIRLQEARRLLLAGQPEAASVAFRVGYESPTQFSREYARMFGLPPISDVKRIRSAVDGKRERLPEGLA